MATMKKTFKNKMRRGLYLKTVNVIGAGLAGSEAAWQVAQAGVPVRLY